jgi:hypothetical protein
MITSPLATGRWQRYRPFDRLLAARYESRATPLAEPDNTA